jgi:hypothetical protein
LLESNEVSTINCLILNSRNLNSEDTVYKWNILF